jgi:hypothetical protein
MHNRQAREEMFAGEADEMVEVNFCSLVDKRVEEQYDLTDGGDLCFNLLEAGVIAEDASVDEAARIVAMHLMQA